MIEFVLLVWLWVPGEGVTPAFEVGEYRQLARCEAARDSVEVQSPPDGSFIAICVEKDK